jgi:hypothetical protein
MEPAPHAEFDNAEIMTGPAPASRFPSIHPFAVLIIFVRDEYGLLVLQHSGFVREEVIRGVDSLGSQSRRGEIDTVDGELGS